MDKLFIVRHTHRFGHSIWPVFSDISEEEVIEKLKMEGDWEDDREDDRDDEEIEIYGPFHQTFLLELDDCELNAELRRRENARRNGLCDFCSKWYDDPTCGNPRHAEASGEWYRRWRFDYGSSYLTAHKDRDTSVTVSRYGTSVKLFGKVDPEKNATSKNSESNARLFGPQMIAETELPVDHIDDYPRSCLNDDERLEWAINWAIAELKNRSKSRTEMDENDDNA